MVQGEGQRVNEEATIVRAVLQGEADAFALLVQRYQTPVYNLMLRLTGNRMTAEDLTQDVFERAYTRLHSLKSGRRFFPWLYTIAVNAGRDHLRKQGLRQDLFNTADGIEGLVGADGSAPAHDPDRLVDAGRLAAGIRRLPVKYGQPLLLYYREGFSVKEIAAVLSISTAAVKVRVHRGREQLKQLLGVDHAN